MSGQLIKLIKISFKNLLHVILTLFKPKQTEMVDSLSSNKAFDVSKLYLKLKYTGTCIAQQTKSINQDYQKLPSHQLIHKS